MRINNRIFPYPVINRQQSLSSYLDKKFSLDYEFVENDDRFILKNVRIVTNSSVIFNLKNEDKLHFVLIVECAASVFRKKFSIGFETKDIVLFKADLYDLVEVSAIGYAKDSFVLNSDEFDEDYQGIDFKIEKYDILAVDDGFSFDCTHADHEGDFKRSIFAIDYYHDVISSPYHCEFNSSRIMVYLSKSDWDIYGRIQASPALMEIFFSQLLVPALIQGLTLCKSLALSGASTLDDIESSYRWFASIRKCYPIAVGGGKELTLEYFRNIEDLGVVAQQLLNCPFEKSINRLYELSKNGGNYDE